MADGQQALTEDEQTLRDKIKELEAQRLRDLEEINHLKLLASNNSNCDLNNMELDESLFQDTHAVQPNDNEHPPNQATSSTGNVRNQTRRHYRGFYFRQRRYQNSKRVGFERLIHYLSYDRRNF